MWVFFSCGAAVIGEYIKTVFVLARTAPIMSFFFFLALNDASLCYKSKSIFERRLILVKHVIWSVSLRFDLCNTSSGWFFTWNVGGNTNLLLRNNFVGHIQHSVLLLLAVIIQRFLLFAFSWVKSTKTSRMEIIDHMRFVVHLLIGRPVMINPNQNWRKNPNFWWHRMPMVCEKRCGSETLG